MSESNKLSFLKSIQTPEKNIKVEIDETKKPFLITFPYPYMNGKLHLGHLFSLSKAEFHSRYLELNNFNVLFPFSFHCTGMPISASAQKLSEEFKTATLQKTTETPQNLTETTQKTTNEVKLTNGVSKILLSLGVKKEELKNFTNPVHWIETFPSIAKQNLIEFELNADWRRSFITTDINPYYDSFVKWQFNSLKKGNFLSFGKRFSIFCPVDNQPCLDHDRQTGEGVLPLSVNFYKITVSIPGLSIPGLSEKYFFCAEYKNRGKDGQIVLSEDSKFVMFEKNKVNFVILAKIFDNLKYQTKIDKFQTLTVEQIKSMKFGNPEISVKVTQQGTNFCVFKSQLPKTEEEKEFATKIKIEESLIDNKRANKKDCELIETENLLQVLIPESEVVSRSGGCCVVSLTDQWFIDYSNGEWKEKTRKCVEKMKLTDETRAILVDGIDWINKWGFSRSFGLGSRVPFDEKYLIDSLSDSTIYMALYTFKHLLFEDFEGRKEIFPAQKLDDSVWEFIFKNRGSIGQFTPEEQKILMQCRKNFTHFYPVGLRVSGKDLLKNHLIFFIMNHVALFDEKFWPKRIFTNGHLLLNSEKMSKSTGNFLTVEECMKKYGVHATRFTLATCGDANEDANFEESVANSAVLKLHLLYEKTDNYLEHNINNINKLEQTEGEDDMQIMKFETYKIFNEEKLDYPSKVLLSGVSALIKNTNKSYESMSYREVTKFGFYELVSLYETYTDLGGDENSEVLIVYYHTIICLLYPILCSFSENLLKKYKLEKKFPVFEFSADFYEALGYSNKLFKKIHKTANKKKKNSVKLKISKEMADWKVEVSKIPKGNYEEISKMLKELNISVKEGMKFAQHHETNNFDEFYNLSNLKVLYERKYGFNIEIEENEKEGDKYNPQIEYF